MSELAEAVLGLAGLVGAIGLVAWLAYSRWGAQVLGLPAMIAVLVIAATWTALSSEGVVVLVAMTLGVLVLMLVIGMAMSIGPERPPRPAERLRRDDR